MAEKTELEKNNMNEGDFFKCAVIWLYVMRISFFLGLLFIFFLLFKTNILIGG